MTSADPCAGRPESLPGHGPPAPSGPARRAKKRAPWNICFPGFLGPKAALGTCDKTSEKRFWKGWPFSFWRACWSPLATPPAWAGPAEYAFMVLFCPQPPPRGASREPLQESLFLDSSLEKSCQRHTADPLTSRLPDGWPRTAGSSPVLSPRIREAPPDGPADRPAPSPVPPSPAPTTLRRL